MADEEHPQHRRTSHAKADEAEAKAEVEKVEAETTDEEPPDYYPARVYSPWELPANTAAAQQMIATGAVTVDESLVPADDVLAAANNNIGLYGHPEDPRLSGGSLVDSPLSAEDLGAPPKRELEEPEEVDASGQTWGQKQEGESEVEKVEKKVEEKV